jgi:hypothetical protein
MHMFLKIPGWLRGSLSALQRRRRLMLILTGAGLLAAGSSWLWWHWVEQRTDGYFAGASAARMRWAYLDDLQQQRSTCLGAHGVLDALQGHPPDFCLPFLPELKREFAKNGLDWEVESRRAKQELSKQQERAEQ